MTPLFVIHEVGAFGITYGSSSNHETRIKRFSGIPSGGFNAPPGHTISLISIFPTVPLSW